MHQSTAAGDTMVSSVMQPAVPAPADHVLPEWAKELSRRAVLRAVKLLSLEDIVVFDDADQDAVNEVAYRDTLLQDPDQSIRLHIAHQTRKQALPKNQSHKSHPANVLRSVHYESGPSSTIAKNCPSACDHPPRPGFRHCEFHVERATARLYHPSTEKWQEELKWLRGFVKTPDNFWLIDTEFTIFKYACPVAFEVCIRKYNGEVILCCPVDYNGATVDQLISRYRSLCPLGHQLHEASESRYVYLLLIRLIFLHYQESGLVSLASTQTARHGALHSLKCVES